ncbi:MAG: GAF domain-containing protein [Firmicutes bacterium]|nr:GAF domain-containing protein [Bacillota bacterium]
MVENERRIAVPVLGDLPWPTFRRLTVATPLAFIVLAGVVLLGVRPPDVAIGGMLAVIVAALVGSVAFSLMLLGAIDRAYTRLEAALSDLAAGNRELEALRSASLAMTQDLDLRVVLRKVADLSREVVGARYAALRVLDPPDRDWAFVASGVPPEVVARLGHPPSGGGLLGFAARAGHTVRLADLTRHPSFSGFPPGHPMMRTFLSTPVVYRDDVLAHLYLTEKIGGGEFTEADGRAIERFAMQAASAIANARLLREVARLSAVEERERIGRELHDGTIQSLYGLSLHLQAAMLGDGGEGGARAAIAEAQGRLHDIMAEIRHQVFGAESPGHGAPQDLGEALRRLVAEHAGAQHPRVEGRIRLRGDGGLEGEAVHNLLMSVREAVANAIRHSGGTRVRVEAERRDGGVWVRVADDGAGIPGTAREGRPGHGLDNMRRRMEASGGRMELETGEGTGTRVTFWLPEANRAPGGEGEGP